MTMLHRVFVIATLTAALIGSGSQVFAASTHASPQAQANLPVCPGPAAPGDTRCHARIATDGNGSVVTNTTPVGYGPAQFQTAYGLTGLTSGQTIGIVDAYDDPNVEKDLQTYSNTFGLPACTSANGCFKRVNQAGGTKYPRGNQGWALETSLDVQIAHAICSGCRILLVEASSNSFSNLLAAEDYAVAHANVVSNSWGGGEFSGETSYDQHFNHPGVPITVSSGDSGYGVEYPASSRYVTAVGGTTLTLNADNTRANETVWSGSGSGCSAYESKSAWQTDTGCAKRTVADVSADADPNTGAAIYDSYGYSGQKGWFQVGGTSLASPLIAGAYALAGNGASTVSASYAYAHTNTLFDVLNGSNGSCGTYLCNALTGYDGPTGLGTPSGAGAF